MGTTSAFLVQQEHQVVREDSAIDPDVERNRAEHELINAGCVCVHSAGIYGPNRSPINWIQDGRVAPSDRYVNFIHVDDLATVLYRAMLFGDPGARYVASDGRPMTWSDIIDKLETLHGINSHPARAARRSSKRIDPSHTVDALGIEITYPDVIQGIASFHRRSD